MSHKPELRATERANRYPGHTLWTFVLLTRSSFQHLSPCLRQLCCSQHGEKESCCAQEECPAQALGLTDPPDHVGCDRTHGARPVIREAESAGAYACGKDLAADNARPGEKSGSEECRQHAEN